MGKEVARVLELGELVEIDRRRIGIAVLLGAFLGVFCIVGVGARIGFSGNEWYLFGMWYNRVLMGVLIGFAGTWKIISGEENEYENAAIRGLVLGTFVTSAILLSMEFRDLPSWSAGIVYGVLIDLGATRFSGE